MDWIRVWRAIALAEGVLLPAILGLAVLRGPLEVPGAVVAVVGATHGSCFTAYLALLPFVARRLRWSRRYLLMAAVASVVPFATWRVEREVSARASRPRSRVAASRRVSAAAHADPRPAEQVVRER
ncbi:MAG: DUF3817 domain-containing protein [Mycobacteriales bacterium]